MVDIDALKRRFESLLPTVDERMRRLIAAAESLAIDYGGISIVSRVTGVSTTDDETVRLLGNAQFRGFLCLSLEPGLPIWEGTVLNAFSTRRSFFLLEPLKLCHRGQERPTFAIFQTNMSLSFRDSGLKRKPATYHAVFRGGITFYPPLPGFRFGYRRF